MPIEAKFTPRCQDPATSNRCPLPPAGAPSRHINAFVAASTVVLVSKGQVCRIALYSQANVASKSLRVAAAYAEAGEFYKASELADRAAQQASNVGNTRCANQITTHTKGYRQGRPYRTRVAATSPLPRGIGQPFDPLTG